jgi:hypothetical protein
MAAACLRVRCERSVLESALPREPTELLSVRWRPDGADLLLGGVLVAAFARGLDERYRRAWLARPWSQLVAEEIRASVHRMPSLARHAAGPVELSAPQWEIAAVVAALADDRLAVTDAASRLAAILGGLPLHRGPGLHMRFGDVAMMAADYIPHPYFGAVEHHFDSTRLALVGTSVSLDATTLAGPLLDALGIQREPD